MLSMFGLMVNVLWCCSILSVAAGGIAPTLFQFIGRRLIESLESQSQLQDSSANDEFTVPESWEDLIEEKEGSRFYNLLAILNFTAETVCNPVDLTKLSYGQICRQIKRKDEELSTAAAVYDDNDKLPKQKRTDYAMISRDQYYSENKNRNVIVGTRGSINYPDNKDVFYGKDIIFHFDSDTYELPIYVAQEQENDEVNVKELLKAVFAKAGIEVEGFDAIDFDTKDTCSIESVAAAFEI